ncbi:MAG: hypothetical protein GY801_19560 [bacterium]|nr:hypothetical protein [bacterium]
MIDLFMAINRNGKMLHFKFNDDVSVIPVWKDEESAMNYLKSQKWGTEFNVDEFSFKVFAQSRDWEKQNGVNLFLHLLD